MSKPARWRKARNPNIGGRWSTPVNNHIWERNHGSDIELWRGDVHLATARPKHQHVWEWSLDIGPDRSVRLAADRWEAKSLAKAAAVEEETVKRAALETQT